MKKRFVITIIALILGAYCAQAQSQVLAPFTAAENARHMTFSQKQFKLLRNLMGLDRETRRMLDAMDVKSMEVLDMGACSESDRNAAKEAVRAAGKADGSYDIREGAPKGTEMYLLTSGETVTGLLVLIEEPGKDDTLIMSISCNAPFDKIAAMAQQR